MRHQINAAIDRHAKIVYIDEAVFSPVTMLKRSWSLPNDNTQITDLRNKVKT